MLIFFPRFCFKNEHILFREHCNFLKLYFNFYMSYIAGFYVYTCKECSLHFITNYYSDRVCRLFLSTLSLIFMSSCVVDIGRHTHSHGWTNTGENRNANRRNEIFPFSLDWTTVANIWSFRSSYTKTFSIKSTIFCIINRNYVKQMIKTHETFSIF